MSSSTFHYILYLIVSLYYFGQTAASITKEEFIDKVDDTYNRVLNENTDDRADDTEAKEELCVNVEYDAICTTEGCSNYAEVINGRDEFAQEIHEIWEDLFDDAIMVIDDEMLSIKFRKGDCEGEYRQKILIEYDEENECISKWIDYFDDVTVINGDGLIDNDYNSVGGFFQKLEIECAFDRNLALNQISNVISKHFVDKISDFTTREDVCDNVEYEAICTTDACDRFVGKASGKDEFLEAIVALYQDLADESTLEYNGDDNTFIFKYRKGECEGEYRGKAEIEYDEENKCISKWIDYFDDITILDKDGLELYDGSMNEFMEKLGSECQFDDQNSEYMEEKEEKIEEMNEQLNDVMNEQDDDSANDDETREDYCEDIEYEAVCNAEECKKFKDKTIGREAFVDDVLKSVWQNLFDEDSMIIDGDMLTLNYRKGECEGEYRQRVQIEYDSENECISKWIDYIDEATIVDKDGLTHSFEEWMNKLHTQCKFDDGSSPSNGYVYNVEVMYLENHEELVDIPTYVQVFGDGADEDELKVEETEVIELKEGSEWNEEFKFDDAESENGSYESLLFKLYGNEEYLGETRQIKVSEIDDCTDEFEFRLEVTTDGKGCGLLVVIITKDGCGETLTQKDYGGKEKK